MGTAPGLHAFSAAEYHADPCNEPSLSASIAHVLLSCSPLHARYQHPRLNPVYQPEESEQFDLGTAAHAYILQGEAGFAIIDAPDWRTKLAKEARDAARAKGQVPILMHRWADVQAMARAASEQLASLQDPPIPFTGGQAEQTLVWQEDGGVWCRARLDWLHDDRLAFADLKTTGNTANPEAWTRGPLFANGYDLQAAFYLRGLKVLFDVDATARVVVLENFAPYALSVIGLTPEALDLAERKRQHALAAWRYCLETNRWPGYPTRTCYAELPGWEETRWMEREARDGQRPAESIDDGRSLEEQLFGDPR